MSATEKEFVVYQVTNISNGFRYIGYTSVGMQRRRIAHMNKAKSRESGCPKFHNALRKYGRDAFVWTVIAIFKNRSEALAEEIRLIAEFRPEYNLSLGGEGVVGVPAHNRRTVTCLSDGRMFTSATAAADFYGISNVSISDVCNGKYRHVKSLYFVYGDVEYPESERHALIKEIERSHALRRKRGGKVDPEPSVYTRRGRRVICKDDGKIYHSASAAARAYGVAKSAIVELCLGKNSRKSVGGQEFSYVDDVS